MKTVDRESSGPDNPNLWHDLFQVSCPHRQALKMIDLFLKETNEQRQWRNACPLRQYSLTSALSGVTSPSGLLYQRNRTPHPACGYHRDSKRQACRSNAGSRADLDATQARMDVEARLLGIKKVGQEQSEEGKDSEQPQAADGARTPTTTRAPLRILSFQTETRPLRAVEIAEQVCQEI